jgi:hypothetical protein
MPCGTARKLRFDFDAAAQLPFKLNPPFGDLTAPVVGRFVEPGIFQLQQVLDDMLSKATGRRSARLAQILDLLRDQFRIDPVVGRPRAAQPRRSETDPRRSRVTA